MTQTTHPQPGATSGRGGRGRRAWLPVAMAVVIALLAGAVVVLLLDRRGDDGAAAPSSPPASETAPAEEGEDAPALRERLSRDDWERTAVGVFRETQPDEVTAYEQWLGREIEIVADFSPRDSWNNIIDPEYLWEAWEDQDRRLTLGVAMIPNDVDDVSIEAGAEGEYDERWTEFGQNLVDAGQEDAILRIGWEFNLEDVWGWATEDEEAWKEYYRRIVTQLDAVEGAEFRYDWNVNNADNGYDAVDYYPGDEYVDYVGVDAYDVDGGTYPYPDDCDDACRTELQQEAWEGNTYGGDRGLRFWSEFAAEHDKQLSLPEWGLWDRNDGTGGADNPYYIEQMADFIEDSDNAVGYQAYFENTNDGGNHRISEGAFPAAEVVYLERFGG